MQSMMMKFSGLRAIALALLVLFSAGLAPTSASQAAEPEFCFGAAGQGCGGWTIGQMPRVAFCVHVVGFGFCKVNGGSMEHDPCCSANPKGKMCGETPESSACSVSWDRAVSRAVWGYQWTRQVDTNRGNATGRVELSKYCATGGSGVHKNDASYCCSKRVRNAWPWENIARPSMKICE